MIAVDTNILIYAHREDSEFHETAKDLLVGLAEGSRRWAIPWPCLHEFVAIVTHPRIFMPPTPLAMALDAVEVWVGSAMCRAIGEGPGYLVRFREVAVKGKVRGAMAHDARVAAICLHNGVNELWTMDRDFTRFPALKTVNPFV